MDAFGGEHQPRCLLMEERHPKQMADVVEEGYGLGLIKDMSVLGP